MFVVISQRGIGGFCLYFLFLIFHDIVSAHMAALNLAIVISKDFTSYCLDTPVYFKWPNWSQYFTWFNWSQWSDSKDTFWNDFCYTFNGDFILEESFSQYLLKCSQVCKWLD